MRTQAVEAAVVGLAAVVIGMMMLMKALAAAVWLP